MAEQLRIEDFPDTFLQRLAVTGRIRRFEAGTWLFREGDESESLFVVESGSVDVGVTSAVGKRITLNILGPGCVFGEIGMLDGNGRTAEAMMVSTAEIRILTKAQVFACFDSLTDAYQFFNLQLCKRIRWINRHTERSRLQPATAIVASRLLMANSASTNPWLTINQATLANQCGLTREYISQILSRWAEQGIIEKRRGELRILQAESLKSLEDN